MKTTTKFMTFAMIIAGAMVSSCSSSGDKVSDAQSDVETAKEGVTEAKEDVTDAQAKLDASNDEYLKEVETYKVETNQRILDNQKSVKEFNARIASDKTAAKEEYQKKIAELDSKNTDMKRKLDNFKANGKDNWETFKTEFSHDMDELGNAFRDLTVKNTKK